MICLRKNNAAYSHNTLRTHYKEISMDQFISVDLPSRNQWNNANGIRVLLREIRNLIISAMKFDKKLHKTNIPHDINTSRDKSKSMQYAMTVLIPLCMAVFVLPLQEEN
uniref:Uncharacterized protein n=1 Tax=Glossina brevipalpis TaxID=37001 RepID=A0A1A9W0B2_9MUSC